MNTDKKVFNKLFTSEKVELASEKFEFGVVQDAIKIIEGAQNDYESAINLFSSVIVKAEPLILKGISEAQKFLNQLSETQKIANELGIDLPKEYLGQKQKAELLIGEAKDTLNWINQY